MLNRIRRAISRTRERHLPKGRHRRSATPVRPAFPRLDLRDRPTPPTGWYRDRTDVLIGEEVELIRPYVLTSEERARTRQRSAPHTWLAPAEAL
ncbi:hypothetical protein GCM10010232_47620 [Streptomyces amakusaensis]|uniref:Uncharacterized protein n=1 Tax=Streptomyces amakusaensis TaxID=67271 RepID=A0ABW0AKZ9_9ACTN